MLSNTQFENSFNEEGQNFVLSIVDEEIDNNL